MKAFIAVVLSIMLFTAKAHPADEMMNNYTITLKSMGLGNHIQKIEINTSVDVSALSKPSN